MPEPGKILADAVNYAHYGFIVSRNHPARPVAQFDEQQGLFLKTSDIRLRKTFYPLNRQGHIATVLFPAVLENLLCLVGIFLHCPTCGR